MAGRCGGWLAGSAIRGGVEEEGRALHVRDAVESGGEVKASREASLMDVHCRWQRVGDVRPGFAGLGVQKKINRRGEAGGIGRYRPISKTV